MAVEPETSKTITDMNKHKTFNFQLSTFNSFLSFLFWMLIFGFAVRLFEATVLGYYHQEVGKHFLQCLLGYGYDLLVFSKFALVLCPLYLLIHHWSPKAAKWTLCVIGTLMLLVSNAMIMYFISAYIPLDKVFFDYSVKELVYISQSTGSFVWWSYVCLLLIPILFFVVYGFRRQTDRKRSMAKIQLFLWLALAVVGLFIWKMPSSGVVCNKQEFFWRSLFDREARFNRFNAKDLEANRERIVEFQSMFPEDQFVDYHYPFAHQDQSPDVLSSYFNLNPDQKPNLVFVINEGLSREFSGYNSKYPSATPFLDSLADQSLCWLNCMSSSQRTIAVLPSMFGSLPFGKRGFMQSSNCPRFYSMISLLQDAGYYASFFYGGWLCFDDMCYFLNDLGVEGYLPDHETYPAEMQNTWGLYDEYLFSESLKAERNRSPLTPYLSIYLTLTTHDPFEYPNKENYTQTYINKLKQRSQLEEIQPSQYEMYASYLYLDDCLRKFFSDYRTMPGYENTIFVITGDHCFNAQSEELDKYHVPFIVWSPMLKEAKRFPAMVSHRDVTPSFLAFMKQSYGIKTPETVSWINTGLDTASCFRANTFTPQLKNSRKMDNMVYKDYFYDEGKVYKFGYENDRLTITPVEEEKVVKLMSDYKALDDYVMNNDALVRLDEDKQRLMVSVDSTQSVNYVLLQSYVRPVDTLDHTNVFKLSNIYPFNMFKEPLSDSLQSVVVYADFDIYIPRQENGGKKILLGFALDHADGKREVVKTMTVNYDWYEYYDRWQHFSMTQSFNKAQVHYVDGDQLMCYFANGGNIEFLIADFQLRIVGIKDN